MLYIPTKTYNLTDGEYENILYSPSKSKSRVIKARNITIWDNYTFYFLKRYFKKDKYEKAFNHYLWLINFIKENYQEGITLITPDIEWMPKNLSQVIINKWQKECKDYPQLYVPDTWENPNLNIVGYALRSNSVKTHPYWNHCLGHKRDNLICPIQTYDAIKEI